MSSPQPAPQRAAHLPLAGVGLLAVVLLVPFLSKPLHMDDPVYVRVAQQIRNSPADYYGFEINWHGRPEPVAVFNKNPPGVSFYLAGASLLTGFGERGLHAAMLPWTLLALLATGVLVRSFGGDAAVAAATLLAMPAFLVSATTLMAEMPLLGLWCAAAAAWAAGLRTGRAPWLVAGAFLAGLAALTKFIGLALLPLLAVWAAVHAPRRLRALPLLLIPLAMVAAFDLDLRVRYGHSLLAEVGSYSLTYRPQGHGPGLRFLTGLSFLGGGLLPGLLFAPLLWRRAALLAWLVAGALLVVSLPALGQIGPLVLRGEGGTDWLASVQLGVFVMGGVHWLALAGIELWRWRDGESLILALWLTGIFVFATFLNWSINARVLLPAAPAAALLLARRLAASPASRRGPAPPWLIPVAASLLVAGAVVWADHRLAGTARDAARQVVTRHAPDDGQIWFRGAWGFQHYAEAAGASKIDEHETLLVPGDVLILPTNNSGVSPISRQAVELIEEKTLPAGRWVATLAAPLGAGFYSDLWGPLPFAFGPAPLERYFVLRLARPVLIRAPGP